MLVSVTQDEKEEEKVIGQCLNSGRAEAWLRLEHTRQTSHWLPWRPAANESDDDCEDPHRLVLSDDIIDVLFEIFGVPFENRFDCFSCRLRGRWRSFLPMNTITIFWFHHHLDVGGFGSRHCLAILNKCWIHNVDSCHWYKGAPSEMSVLEQYNNNVTEMY